MRENIKAAKVGEVERFGRAGFAAEDDRTPLLGSLQDGFIATA